MTWPTGAVNTANTDSSSDSPATARADILDLQQKVNTIISNGESVWVAGNQTVAGTKTFSSSPVVPAPSASNHAARKETVENAQTAAQSYADGLAAELAIASYRRLKLSATGTNATISVSADALVLLNGSGKAKLVVPSLSINAAASGANGLDTGALASSTWYSVWVIWNGTTTAGLISLSDSAPTLPSGYTFKARVGWIRTDGSANKYPLSFIQYGRIVKYVIRSGSNVTAHPIMAIGVSGDIFAPSWTSVSVGGFVPSTASSLEILLFTVGASGVILVAPNSSYSAWNSSGAPPFQNSSGTSAAYGMPRHTVQLESTSIYWASSVSSQGLLCTGWEDNL